MVDLQTGRMVRLPRSSEPWKEDCSLQVYLIDSRVILLMPELKLSSFSARMLTHCLFSLPVSALAVVCITGCVHRTPSIGLPSYNASRIGSATFEALDANHDNMLDAKELEKAPGLKAALVRIDSNKDGRISAEEIEARIGDYQKAGLGLRNETYIFTLNGAPLGDAKVVFTPESFFGSSIQAGEGQTGTNGSTSIKITGNTIPGMTCGMYRVSVSKKDGSGKELLPAKYNTETTLGYEFPPEEFSSDKDRTFALTTR